MFKDYNKYLTTSVKVYLFVLVIIFILKLVGLDYFGLDTSNYIVNEIDVILDKIHFKKISFFIGIMIYQYLMVSIICRDNSKKMKLYNLCSTPITFAVQYAKLIWNNHPTTYILEFVYLAVLCKIYNKNIKVKDIIKKLFIMFILQFISNFTRNKADIQYEVNYVKNLILNLDYFVMMLLYQSVELKGGIVCQDIVGSFLLMKANLKKSLIRLQKNLHNFKYKPKQERIALSIYFTLSFIWNTLSIAVVLIVARLNHTFIECIFILTSFWLSKHTFGKAFHLKSMEHCFIVSNLTYYVLNRLTTPIGISVLVPVMLGVGLSYVTSKFVKDIYKPLYRGMPIEIFDRTILRVTDKNSLIYNICYEYYIGKKKAINLSMKYNYSEAGIRKILDNVNKKIKELN